MEPLKISFIVPDAYPVIDPAVNHSIGGWETRAWLFARGLVSLNEGMEASFVLRTPRRIQQTSYDGVQLIHRAEPLHYVRKSVSQCVDVLKHFPWLSIQHWQPSLLWNIPLLAACRPFRKPSPPSFISEEEIAEIDADFYCCFGVSTRSAAIGSVVRSLGKKNILFIGSNCDLDERYQSHTFFINQWGERGEDCYRAIMNADAIVAQNKHQQTILKNRFGRSSIVISSPVDVSQWDSEEKKTSIKLHHPVPERYVLWVGRADRQIKRPLLCLELAKRLPEIQFLMILNPDSQEVENEVIQQCPANVTIVPRVQFSKMPMVMSRATIFLNTSAKKIEGFPNVFLQAASAGIPIASLEASAEFIEQADAGCCANGDMKLLGDYLQTAWNDSQAAAESTYPARDYVLRHHGHLQQSKKLAIYLSTIQASTEETKVARAA